MDDLLTTLTYAYVQGACCDMKLVIFLARKLLAALGLNANR